MLIRAKIVQMSGKLDEKPKDFHKSFPECSLSYEKIVQMSGKRREKPQDFHKEPYRMFLIL